MIHVLQRRFENEMRFYRLLDATVAVLHCSAILLVSQYKPAYGNSGLSAQLWGIRKGKLDDCHRKFFYISRPLRVDI